MLKRRFAAGMFSAGVMVLGAGMVSGQNYPSKPVRIVTSPAGGGSDYVSRLIASGLTGSLGQQVIVENRPSGVIPGETVAKAPPDGYILLVGADILWTTPLFQKTPYDILKDFAPIALTGRTPIVVVVHPSLPVKSIRELIALAKARPGVLNYASGPAGSSLHLAAELFKNLAGVNVVRIPYKGGGPAVVALVGGEVELMFAPSGVAFPHLLSGRLRGLAVGSTQQSLLFPDLPTVAAAGLPGFVAASLYGIFAPAGTPAAIINRLNHEIVQLLNNTDMKEKFLKAKIEPVGSSPEELAATMKSDIARNSKLIKDAGIRVK